jgi:hypothetical protein
MLDRVKAGACRPGMRQQALVVGPWYCRLLHDIHDDPDLKAIYVKSNFIFYMNKGDTYNWRICRYIINSYIYQIMDAMWSVSVTQLGIYYIRKRLLHVNCFSRVYLHDIKG